MRKISFEKSFFEKMSKKFCLENSILGIDDQGQYKAIGLGLYDTRVFFFDTDATTSP